jgi:hypothetical protein
MMHVWKAGVLARGGEAEGGERERPISNVLVLEADTTAISPSVMLCCVRIRRSKKVGRGLTCQ